MKNWIKSKEGRMIERRMFMKVVVVIVVLGMLGIGNVISEIEL